MLAFQVIPIFYTVQVAFTNYSTGHILAKDEAIEGIQGNSLAPPPDGKSYLMAPARDADGALVLLLVDEDTGNTFVGTTEELIPIERSSVQVDDLGIAERRGVHARHRPRAGHASTASSRRSPCPRPARRRSGPRAWTPPWSSSRRCATTR